MISEPIALTVGAEAYGLNRVKVGNYTAEYFDVSAAGTERHTFKVSHTVPTGNETTETHHVRCDIDNLDADGLVERTDSVWIVFKSAKSAQNTAALVNLFTGLVAMLQASTNANLLKVLGRES